MLKKRERKQVAGVNNCYMCCVSCQRHQTMGMTNQNNQAMATDNQVPMELVIQVSRHLTNPRNYIVCFGSDVQGLQENYQNVYGIHTVCKTVREPELVLC